MLFSSRSLPSLLSLVLLVSLPLPAAASSYPQASSQGQSLFEGQCSACHSVGPDRLIGPGLEGIASHRDREWLVAFITDPDRMVAEGDSVAVSLLEEYRVPMPNLGLSREQAESILDYLAEAEGATATSQPATPLAAGDAATGRELFTGVRGLENGGAACISCHNVAALGSLGGGTLGKDLTAAAANYGSGLAALIDASPFPAMQAVYGGRPLTSGEVANLTAFLVAVEQDVTPANSRLPFFAAGFGGMVLLTVLTGLMWRGRLRGVRKPLIGEGR